MNSLFLEVFQGEPVRLYQVVEEKGDISLIDETASVADLLLMLVLMLVVVKQDLPHLLLPFRGFFFSDFPSECNSFFIHLFIISLLTLISHFI